VTSTQAVTVITAAYNCEKYLEACVRSVQEQTLPPREHIIVDDCSTDGTYELALRLAEECTTVPIQVLHMPQNGGAAAARNAAIEATTTEWVGILDSDDIALPDWLALVFETALPDTVVWVGGGGVVMDEHGTALTSPDCSYKRGNVTALTRAGHFPFLHPGSLFRRSVIQGLGGYDVRVRASHDHDLMLRVSYVGELVHSGRPHVMRRVDRRAISQSMASYQNAVTRLIERKAELLASGAAPEEIEEMSASSSPELARILRENPSRPGGGHYKLALLYHLAGRRSDARAAYWQALRQGYSLKAVLPRLLLASLPIGIRSVVERRLQRSWQTRMADARYRFETRNEPESSQPASPEEEVSGGPAT